eukprot:gene7818-10620_t
METLISFSSKLSILPELVVFDLDNCMWLPEMYCLSTLPTTNDVLLGDLNGNGEGVIGVKSGKHDVIRLFPEALAILQEIYLGKYPGVRIAAASTADTPFASSIAHASMRLLEIFPNVKMIDVFLKDWNFNSDEPPSYPHIQHPNILIGRTFPLNSEKSASHFPLLKQSLNIPYSKMLFFDDCLWDDHCSNVERHCPGVVTQRTPSGMQIRDWMNGLKSYEQKYSTKYNIPNEDKS